MARLQMRQFRRLLESVGELYAHQDLDGFAAHVMQVSRHAVAADFAAYDEIHLRRRRHTWASDPPDLDLSASPEAHQTFFEEHPFVLHLQRTGDVPPVRLSDFHLRERRADPDATAVDFPASVIVTVDPRGRIRACPRCVRQWFAHYFEQSPVASDALPEIVRRWMKQHRKPGTRADDAPPARSPLIVDCDGRRLTIRHLADEQSGQLLLIAERPSTWSPEPLQQLGLTARQGEVLLWVAQGKTNGEIARILGLSPGTIHKHLEHVFAKLRVETRTAAAACAWERLGPAGALGSGPVSDGT